MIYYGTVELLRPAITRSMYAYHWRLVGALAGSQRVMEGPATVLQPGWTGWPKSTATTLCKEASFNSEQSDRSP